MDAFLLYSFLIILLLLAALGILSRETFDQYIPEYLNHKSKCFDCEKEILNNFGEDAVWIAQPSKMFAAESEGMSQTGTVSGGFLGKTIKYY
jgi:hypothetical protein